MFIQPDWFEVTKAGVGTNRYAYSGNDPVNISDPNGNCPMCIIPAIIGAYLASVEPANAPGPDDTPISQSPAQTITNMTAGAIGGKAAGIAIEMCAGACRAALHLGKTRTDEQGSIVTSDEKSPNSQPNTGDDIGTGLGPMRREVDDPRLDAILDSLYGQKSIPGGRVGNGGTSDALRHETTTGKLLSPSGHKQKASEMVARLESYVKRATNSPNPNRDGHTYTKRDIDFAMELIRDLQDALTK